MNITPNIITISEKKLIGKSITMSLADNKTFQLFSHFMPVRKQIKNMVSSDIYDLRIYPSDYYLKFDSTNYFEKWALLEVSNFKNIPKGMKTFILKSGLYAVFHYRGLSTDTRIFSYIFNTWLPNSSYRIDDRPHFEILGEKYKNNNPDSEEDIYIPIKLKS